MGFGRGFITGHIAWVSVGRCNACGRCCWLLLVVIELDRVAGDDKGRGNLPGHEGAPPRRFVPQEGRPSQATPGDYTGSRLGPRRVSPTSPRPRPETRLDPPPADPRVANAISLGAGGVALLALAAAFGQLRLQAWAHVSAISLAAAASLLVLDSLAGFSLYTRLLRTARWLTEQLA